MECISDIHRKCLALGAGALLFLFLVGFAAEAENGTENLSTGAIELSDSAQDRNQETTPSTANASETSDAMSQVANAATARLRSVANELPPFPIQRQSPIWMSRTSAAKHNMALRLTQQGESRLRAGDPRSALSLFEKALGLEASPYVYISLARAHYMLGHYGESLNFIEVAESWLNQDSNSVPEVTAFKATVPGSGLTEQKFPDASEIAASDRING